MLLESLLEIWSDDEAPFLQGEGGEVRFSQLKMQMSRTLIEGIRPGDVVAHIGDFDLPNIAIMIRLLDIGAILVPLTSATLPQHQYFFDSAQVDWIIQDGIARKRNHKDSNHLLTALRQSKNPGLVLFTSGTTGQPKAILHDFSVFLRRYSTPRPAMRTLAFLLFDHIGGINTLFHTLFNKGEIVSLRGRAVGEVLEICEKFSVEILPTTPTFLRMLLIGGITESDLPKSLKVITYGTERMDGQTLEALAIQLPKIDFRQTYGMSELGILRVKSKSRSSLFMAVGGEGVETRVERGTLRIKSESRMLGYLNAPSPFDEDGWYDTGDLVEVEESFIRIVGRANDLVSVGGLKFTLSEVEDAALTHPAVEHVRAFKKNNPITGSHVELLAQIKEDVDCPALELKWYLFERLPKHMVPLKVEVGQVRVGHRVKKV